MCTDLIFLRIFATHQPESCVTTAPNGRGRRRDHHRATIIAANTPTTKSTYARAAAPQIASAYDTSRQRGERAAREKAARAQEDDLYFV